VRHHLPAWLDRLKRAALELCRVGEHKVKGDQRACFPHDACVRGRRFAAALAQSRRGWLAVVRVRIHRPAAVADDDVVLCRPQREPVPPRQQLPA